MRPRQAAQRNVNKAPAELRRNCEFPWCVALVLSVSLGCSDSDVRPTSGHNGTGGSQNGSGGAAARDDASAGGSHAGTGGSSSSGGKGSGGSAGSGGDSEPPEGGSIEDAATDGGGGAPLDDGSGGYAGCDGPSPTEGFTEYTDTFKVQHPYDLAESARFSFENGVYTTWVLPDDKGYSASTPTGPRTEMRWSQNWSTGERIWDGDVLIESPASQSCIMQVKGNNPVGGEAVYLQVNDGKLRNSVKPPFLMDSYDRWMNIKTAYNTATGTARVWVNNCLMYTTQYTSNTDWYFKNGTYGCNASICKAHFKNIRFWKK